MKILVTGGGGFIGSNVVDGYIREGHQVVVVDNLYTGKKANINPKAIFYPFDIRSRDIESLMEKEKPDVLQRVKERFAAWQNAMEQAEPRGPFRDY